MAVTPPDLAARGEVLIRNNGGPVTLGNLEQIDAGEVAIVPTADPVAIVAIVAGSFEVHPDVSPLRSIDPYPAGLGLELNSAGVDVSAGVDRR